MEKIICKKCRKSISEEDFINNLKVCPQCGFHDMLSAHERIKITADEGSFTELAKNLFSVDFLKFHDVKPYSERLEEAMQKSGISEAVVAGEAEIKGIKTSICFMDFSFMGGSMGSVVGEKIKITADNSIEKNLPLVIFCASGGARMQEGIISLMQMAKTVSCIHRLRQAGLAYFCIITHPTTGGVSASFATIADIIITEPGALFCFAGPRVVEQTIKKEIPSDFGLAERNIKNGLVDMILKRHEIRDVLAKLLYMFTNKN